jgi:hypothetical protein
MSENHSLDHQPAHQEPPGGWVTGPDLIDTEVLLVQLCRYTAMPLRHSGCLMRHLGRHPDEDCQTYFVSIKALHDGQVNLDQLDLDVLPTEVRANDMGQVTVIGNE